MGDENFRREVAKIMQDKAATPAEKNRRIQTLMTRQWAAAAAAAAAAPTTTAAAAEAEKPSGEKQEMARKAVETPSWFDESKGIRGCQHYARDCRLVAACCSKVFPCRLCHDESETSHQINRFETSECVCCRCGTLQPASNSCVSESCHGQPFARYWCPICKLWDSTPGKEIYHCPGCGICRVGKGLEIDRKHCDTCGCCYHMTAFQGHKCIPRKMHQDCPVCRSDLFSSTKPVVFIACGHSLHDSCLRQLTRSGNYRCPLCSKSVGDMADVWERIDEMIAGETMPPEWTDTRCKVACNDCLAKAEVKFHFTGLKCPSCGSFNTTSMGLINPPLMPAPGAQPPQPPTGDVPSEGDDEEDEEDEEEEEEEEEPK